MRNKKKTYEHKTHIKKEDDESEKYLKKPFRYPKNRI